MRFLLFNIVVAGALIFLFTSDKAELHAAADRAHDAANGIKSKAFEVIGTQQTAKPVETAPATSETASNEAPADTATAETEETFSLNKPLPPVAADAVREVQVATRKLVEPQAIRPQPVKPLPPEVEQRREEVLAEGIIGEPATEAQKYMPPSTRKRDLMLLSEEMELFSAEAISR